MLGFLSVSTLAIAMTSEMPTGFNPVLGFLSVSTWLVNGQLCKVEFQSRAGFSECLDFQELIFEI